MKVLHVLDHSLPVQSGYAVGSAALIREQRRMGWEMLQLTGPKQGRVTAATEIVGGIEYLRAPGHGGWLAALPAGEHLKVVCRLRAELRRIRARENPDLIQAHSPGLNGLAALGLGRPLVYELRSSREDAAACRGNHGVGCCDDQKRSLSDSPDSAVGQIADKIRNAFVAELCGP